MLKFIEKRKAEKLRLENFKKSIKGMFDEWVNDQYTIDTKIDGIEYSLWTNRGLSGFRDYRGNLLECFTPKEKELLWEELQCKGYPSCRKRIFNEFCIKGEDKPKAKPKKKKE